MDDTAARVGSTAASDAGALAAEWDTRVETWEATCAGPAFLRFRDRAVQAAQLNRDDVVLDVGCGTGLLALEAAKVAREVIALDIAPRMLEAVTRNARSAGLDNVTTVLADARSLPLPSASVDIVLSGYTLHHLDDEGKAQALVEIERVLKPGGHLVLVDMMFTVSLAPEDRRIILTKAWQMLRKGPAGVVRLAKNAARIWRGQWEHPASRSWWEQAAGAAGFRAVRSIPLEKEAGMVIAIKAS